MTGKPRNLDEKHRAAVDGTKVAESQPRKRQAQRPENLLVDLVYGIPAECFSTTSRVHVNTEVSLPVQEDVLRQRPDLAGDCGRLGSGS